MPATCLYRKSATDECDQQEWQQGYKSRFGMQYVNFTDPAVSDSLFHCLRLSLTITQLPRYYKASFFEYINAFKIYGGYDKED